LIIELENLILFLEELKPKIISLGKAIDAGNSEKKLILLEKEISSENFWDNREKSTKILEKFRNLKNKIEKYNKLKNDFEELTELTNFCLSENDSSLIRDIKLSAEDIRKRVENQTLLTLLSGPHDANNAILTLHAGAGGTEAQDWVEMLYRMYCRWAEKSKMRVKTLDFLDGEEAGLKNVSILMEGENAYGLLKSESGVHRLVRISPFDASGRRHTSFAAVEVIPEINDKIELNIPPDDIKMDVFRASGAGGQHVNKTSSAVRLTHIPTGIVVTCQNERSQIQNRETAMRTLKSKLLEVKERERLEKIEDIKGVQKEIAWGSQIRSYVFMPYTLVKDHRTGVENGNINSVMNGNINCFIDAYLRTCL
jgi:peptide chain release factor 2